MAQFNPYYNHKLGEEPKTEYKIKDLVAFGQMTKQEAQELKKDHKEFDDTIENIVPKIGKE